MHTRANALPQVKGELQLVLKNEPRSKDQNCLIALRPPIPSTKMHKGAKPPKRFSWNGTGLGMKSISKQNQCPRRKPGPEGLSPPKGRLSGSPRPVPLNWAPAGARSPPPEKIPTQDFQPAPGSMTVHSALVTQPQKWMFVFGFRLSCRVVPAPARQSDVLTNEQTIELRLRDERFQMDHTVFVVLVNCGYNPSVFRIVAANMPEQTSPSGSCVCQR